MEWSLNSHTDENGIDVDGEFNILGRTYTYDEDTLPYILGGLGMTTLFSVLVGGMIYILVMLATVYSWVIVGMIEIALTVLLLAMLIGCVKLLITGDARPFVKFESEENRTRVAFFEW